MINFAAKINLGGEPFVAVPLAAGLRSIRLVHRVLAEERDIVIRSRSLEATSFDVDGIRMTYVFYESGLSINVVYGLEDGSKPSYVPAWRRLSRLRRR